MVDERVLFLKLLTDVPRRREAAERAPRLDPSVSAGARAGPQACLPSPKRCYNVDLSRGNAPPAPTGDEREENHHA